MHCFLLFLIVYAAVVTRSTAELYSAMAGLEALLDTQRAIINTLENYIQESKRKVHELTRRKKEYESLYNISSVKFHDFISNPVNAFVLMKKLSMDWNETHANLDQISANATDLLKVVYPDYEDITGAAKALLRVQQTYGLDTAAVSRGILPGSPKGLELSADDCFEMGKQAFHAGYFDYALSWMEEAQTKSTLNADATKDDYGITKYLKMSEQKKHSFTLFTSSLLQLEAKNNVGNTEAIMQVVFAENNSAVSQNEIQSAHWTHPEITIFKCFASLKGYMMSPFIAAGLSNSLSLESAETNAMFTSQMTVFDEASYRKLCKTKNEITRQAVDSQMKCRLVDPHPYLKLQPVKEEELWKNPKISLYYDVISDKEIDILKSLAVPMLERAEVAEYTGQLGHRVSDTRVTKIAWLNKEDHPVIPQLYRRIEHITGLSSRSAEPFQMANYGLGGHFHLHMDVLPDTEKYYGPDMGNRIATWLTYISDVQAGGATVFPRLNLTVWPKKGSALFWHNVKSNGVGNILTLHGACPVVSGSKWVSNVWFHERDQEFRLKCGRFPESALQPTGWFNKS